MNQEKKSLSLFALIFLSCLLLLSALVIALHVIVDPDNRYNLVNIPSIEKRKGALVESGKNKTHLIQNTDANCIILGTSRSEAGILPESISDYNCINVSLMHGSIHDMQDILNFADHYMDIKSVFFGIDYAMFLPNEDKVLHSYTLPNQEDKEINASFTDMLSVTKLIDIIRVLAGEPVKSSDIHEDNGVRKTNRWQESFERNGHAPMFLHNERRFIMREIYNKPTNRTQETRKRTQYKRPHKKLGNNNKTQHISYQNKMQSFNAILKLCHSKGIKLYPFISPVHIRQIHLIDTSDRLNDFFQWKHELLEQIAKRDSSIDLWDFSYIQGISDEAVPKDRSPMQWYWESQHYKQALGQLVLDEMQSQSTTFIINAKNVDAINENQRIALQEFKHSNKRVVKKHVNWNKRYHAL
ncbi:MAG: hypothetical protein HRU20_00685 [Pseudomonadales bacterium]|nr:hypothetical protein [Pseudomonadales bacterium]